MTKSLSLSPALWAHAQQTYRGIVAQPPSAPELRGFSRLLNLAAGTRVIVVEAPAHPRLRRWARATQSYASDMNQVRREARRRRVPFWRVPTAQLIPADGWADFVHLNARGAEHFSEWLGARLAAR